MKEEGFTLLEILIAITITGIVFGAVFAFLHQGLMIWEDFGEDEDYSQYIRVLDSNLKNDLKYIFCSEYSTKNLLKGDYYSGLEFYILKDDILQKIRYEADYRQNSIVKTATTIDELTEDTEEKTISFVVGKEITDILFYYYNPENNYWESSWSYSDETKGYLPAAVKIEIKHRKGDNIEKLVEILGEIYVGRIYK
ncbi:prepilin-type N-terminal cleavage/methylation domain-containing protein [Iocasia frigidifontis]|uniref:Prepilin-type N-terminal cleavage/methylation domain-containing protein n=1 Tax=Iocasia fonsfrigidae TaxID=2682810 RepID=A0A8A7K7J7_9FIRM|nr:prepilin-type N-terminal cleavage/methylation domain-containing protein [Iocasia fonsfrigidae]QTL97160.1 prepilin-type N-terminal cleavage/methylation domain-containing protein [Iocasia fonsfrigidae]